MRVETYLYFDGCCEQAVEFYRDTLDAEILALLRFKDNPEPPQTDEQADASACAIPPGCDDKIMHVSFRIGHTEIMASDGFCGGKPDFQGFALTLVAADKASAQAKFSLLAEGGEVKMPLAETFFSPCFGMVCDRFGVLWNVLAEPYQ